MKGTYTRTVNPTSEPITTSELKTHLKIDWADEDTYLDALIQASREMCEAYTNLSFFTQTYTVQLDDFPSDSLLLLKGPIQQISSVKYYDENDNEQTLETAKYYADLNSFPGRIYFTETEDVYDDRFNAVTITMVNGYSATSDIPEAIKQAIKLQASELYENREDANKKTGFGFCKTSRLLLNAYKAY